MNTKERKYIEIPINEEDKDNFTWIDDRIREFIKNYYNIKNENVLLISPTNNETYSNCNNFYMLDFQGLQDYKNDKGNVKKLDSRNCFLVEAIVAPKLNSRNIEIYCGYFFDNMNLVIWMQ